MTTSFDAAVAVVLTSDNSDMVGRTQGRLMMALGPLVAQVGLEAVLAALHTAADVASQEFGNNESNLVDALNHAEDIAADIE